MVGASKILTVSYGTFSCTLEGFDDPFSAMKAIAEYFRELAANDRYFGAEPPTPDAEMLHRIAEREVQRRVEARVSENGVVLRAKSDELAPTEEAAPAASSEADEPADAESIAAKLMRIRAVVAASRATAEANRTMAEGGSANVVAADDEGETSDEFAFGLDLDEDLDNVDFDDTGLVVVKTRQSAEAENVSVTVEDASFAKPASSAEPETDEGFPESAASVPGDSTVAETPVLDPVAATGDAPTDSSSEQSAETEAGRSDTVSVDEVDTPEATEDEIVAAEELTDDITTDAEDTIGEEAEAPTSTGTRPAAGDHGATVVEEEFSAADANETLGDSADGVVEQPEAAEAVTHSETTAVVSEEAVATDSQEMELLESEDGDADAKEGALNLAAWRTDDPLPADIPVHDPDEDEEWTPVSGARARVIKIDRAPDVPQRTAAASAPVKDADTSRSAIFAALVDDISPDAEEEPQNEEVGTDDDATLLAGIGAAIGGSETKSDDELERDLAAIAKETRRETHEGRAILESSSGDGNASMERLMEEAKSKLEGIENRRRFSAISHLKAAVAATVADRKLSSSHDLHPQSPDETDTDMNRYRDDLSKAVRPRHPEPEAKNTATQPKEGNPAAPLVLVSEQRVGESTDEPGHDSMQSPRLGTHGFMRDDEEDDFDHTGDDAPVSPEDAKSFADFAERLGANGLPELLEAAAAYTAMVEGQPHFSRPQILRKVADVAEETDFSREDGLRSFGLLLREGKIQKISRGQFTITETSKFMAEEKTASR